MLCALLSVVAFSAHAAQVTVKFSNVNAVSEILYNWGSSSMPVAKTVTWNTDTDGNLQVYLKSGCTPGSIVNSNTNFTFELYNHYSYNNYGSDPKGDSITLYGSDFGSNTSDGDEILITLDGGAPEQGGSEPEGDYIAYFKCSDPSAITVEAGDNYDFYWETETVDGGVVLKVKEDFASFALDFYYTFWLYSNTATIKSVTQDGTPLTGDEGWYYIGPLKGDAKSQLVVELDQNSNDWVYTINTSGELYFNPSSSSDFSISKYDNGVYTITLKEGATGVIELQQADDWAIIGATASNGPAPRTETYGANSSSCFINIGDYPESTEFTLDFGATFNITSPLDVLTFSGEGVTAEPYNDGAYAVTVTYPNSINGTIVDTFADKYSLSSVRNTATSASVSVTTGTFTISVNPSWKNSQTVAVALAYNLTGEGPEGLTVKFGSSTFKYDDGKYTLRSTATTKNAITATSTAETLAVTSIDYNNNNYEAVNGTATVPAADFNMEVLDFKINTEEVVPVRKWTFNCAADVLTFTQQDNAELTSEYANGAYTLTGMVFYGPSLMVTAAEGYTISAFTVADGSPVSPFVSINGNQASVTAYNMDGNAIFDVTLAEVKDPAAEGVTFEFANPTQIAGIYAGTSASDTALSLTNGKYVWTAADGDNLFVQFNPQVKFTSFTNEAGDAVAESNVYTVAGSVENGQNISIQVTNGMTRGQFETGKVYTITTEEEVVDQPNIITITVTDQNYVTAKAGSVTLQFEDNSFDFDRNELGNVIKFTATNGATLLNAVVSENGGTLSYPTGNFMQTGTVSVADVVKGATVSIGLNVPKNKDFTFDGIEGLSVTLDGKAADYENGVYTISNILSTSYSAVQVSVPAALASTVELVGVTPDNGSLIEPYEGVVYINTYEYNESQHFTIVTKDLASVENITFTVNVAGGNGYEVSFGNVTTNKMIDLNTGANTVTIEKGETIFIGKTYGELASVVVDGVTIPAEECQSQDEFFNLLGYLIKADSPYYPQDKGTITINVSQPAQTFKVSFNFVNEGTEGFITDIGVGNGYLDASEKADAYSNGLTVEENTYINLKFNTADYSVTSATVNGQSLGLNQNNNTYSVQVEENLEFEFEVTLQGGTTFKVISDGWEHVIVTDPDQNTYTLTGVETDLQLSSMVERLRFTAAEGYEIPEKGVVATTATGATEAFNQGDGIFVAEYVSATITVNKTDDNPSASKTFTFTCSADVITFTGGTAGMGNPEREEVAVKATYADGVYTVTNVPAYLTLTVNEDARDQYVLAQVVTPQGTMTSQDGVTVEFATGRFNNNDNFSIEFASETAPIYITVEVDNPSCVARVYSEGETLTTFPGQYNLRSGRSVTVEAKTACKIDGIEIDGVAVAGNYPAERVVVDLTDVEEGATLSIKASAEAGAYTYTFQAVEGLSITYNSVEATYEDGDYTLNNIQDSNSFSLFLSVAPGYQNQVKLEKVAVRNPSADLAVTEWTPTGTSSQIIIVGSELPKANTTFVVTTSKPAVSETTRQIQLTIDNVEAIRDAFFQSAAGRFSFDEDGVATLTITPSDYEVNIQTNESVTAIESDAADFTAPALPSTNLVLNLSNVAEGESVNMYTELIEIMEPDDITYDVENGKAIVTLPYRVSNVLVGRNVAVKVNSNQVDQFIPSSNRGTLSVEVPGITDVVATHTVSLESDHYATSRDLELSGVNAIWVDGNGSEIEIYTLQGIKVKPQNLVKGVYIVNGKKVLINK